MRTKIVLTTSLVLAGLLGGLLAYHRASTTQAAEAAKVAAMTTQIPAGTEIHVRLNQTLDTARNRAGDRFSAVLMSPVMVNGDVALPKGTPFQGHITAAKPSGRLKGRGYMAYTLDSFEFNGQNYTVATSTHSRATASHKKRNWLLIGGGSGFGALVGGLAGGGKGALIGGGAGAAAGTAGAALTGRKHVQLPAETPLTFRLREPIQVRTRGANA